MKKLELAILQNSAGLEVETNLDGIDRLLEDVGEVDLLLTPEVFALRGDTPDYRKKAEPLDGPLMERMSRIAQKRQCWFLLGSVLEREDDFVYNTTVLLNRNGDISATYRKIHLFEAHLENEKVVREADAYDQGSDPGMAEIEGWRVGLSICYDLRFPELYRHYARLGADLLFAPANFTQRTGRDHWDVLVRARAIENQCFVVAPGQCGPNPITGIESYGHSIVVGPWGRIIAQAADFEQVLEAELDPKELLEIRKRIPALEHQVLGLDKPRTVVRPK